jgi:hypothetical protein
MSDLQSESSWYQTSQLLTATSTGLLPLTDATLQQWAGVGELTYVSLSLSYLISFVKESSHPIALPPPHL